MDGRTDHGRLDAERI